MRRVRERERAIRPEFVIVKNKLMSVCNNNKLYSNTMAIELMCFYKYSKNAYII